MHFVDLWWCVWKLDMPQKNWVCFPYFFKVSFRGSLLSLPYKNCEKSLSFPRFSTVFPPKNHHGFSGASATTKAAQGRLAHLGRARGGGGRDPSLCRGGGDLPGALVPGPEGGRKWGKGTWFFRMKMDGKWMEKICKFYEVFISLICDIYIPSFKDEEWCTLMISLTNISWIFHYIPIIPPWFVWENSEIDGKDVWKWL